MKQLAATLGLLSLTALSCGDDARDSATAETADGGVANGGDGSGSDPGAFDPDVPVDCQSLPAAELLYEAGDESVGRLLVHGDDLYYTDRDGVFRASVSGEKELKRFDLPPPTTDPVLSIRTALAIVKDRFYLESPGELIKLNQDGSRDGIIVLDDPESMGSRSWAFTTTDGESLFAWTKAGCKTDDDGGGIWRVDADDTVTQLVSDTACVAAIAAGGDYIYYIEKVDLFEKHLFRVEKSGGAAEAMPLNVDDWGSGDAIELFYSDGYLFSKDEIPYVRGIPNEMEPQVFSRGQFASMGGNGKEVFGPVDSCIGVVQGAGEMKLIGRYDPDELNIVALDADDDFIYFAGDVYNGPQRIYRVAR